MFKKNKGKMYYVNSYYDVIDDLIAIYNVIEMAPSSYYI